MISHSKNGPHGFLIIVIFHDNVIVHLLLICYAVTIREMSCFNKIDLTFFV